MPRHYIFLSSSMRRMRALAMMLALSLLAIPLAEAAPPLRNEAPAQEAAREAIRLLLDGEAARLGVIALDRASLRRFYERRQFEPAWLSSAERAASLLAVLATAPEHG